MQKERSRITPLGEATLCRYDDDTSYHGLHPGQQELTCGSRTTSRTEVTCGQQHVTSNTAGQQDLTSWSTALDTTGFKFNNSD